MNAQDLGASITSPTTLPMRIRSGSRRAGPSFRICCIRLSCSLAPPPDLRPSCPVDCNWAWAPGRRPTPLFSRRAIFRRPTVRWTSSFRVRDSSRFAARAGIPRIPARHFDGQGTCNIVTGNGDPVQPQITIPQQATAVTIALDGTVSYTQPGQQPRRWSRSSWQASPIPVAQQHRQWIISAN